MLCSLLLRRHRFAFSVMVKFVLCRNHLWQLDYYGEHRLIPAALIGLAHALSARQLPTREQEAKQEPSCASDDKPTFSAS
jgi:hypothetical protein